MKKIFIILFAVSVLIVNYNLSKKKGSNSVAELALMNTEMLAYAGTIPEITITCGLREGACWRMDWHSMTGFTQTCEFTGLQVDHCIFLGWMY